MIENDAQLDQALRHLGGMYHALADLKTTVLPQSEAWFGVMAEGPLDEMTRLEAAIAEYAGRSLAEQHGADLWLRLQGAELGWPAAPSSILASFIETVRKGVQAATEWLHTNDLSTRPTKAVKQACDLRVVALQPGSLQIGLALPGAEADDDLARTVSEALVSYTTVAQWVSSDEPTEALDEAVPDPELRRLLLAEVKRLAPRPRGEVESIELSGRAVSRPNVRLTREAHARLDAAVDATTEEQVETHAGDLREIDLDRLSFTLRNVAAEPYEVACEFPPELLDTAVEALDKRVEVRGVRRVEGGRGQRRQRLHVLRLAVLESDEGDPRA